jgi:hypothetical protein
MIEDSSNLLDVISAIGLEKSLSSAVGYEPSGGHSVGQAGSDDDLDDEVARL